jgi:hypothetical protein
MKEGNLSFQFPQKYQELKFDDTNFYKSKFMSYMPDGKGVDCIAFSESEFILMEVKNFSGYEKDNIWRTHTDSAVVNIEKQDIGKRIANNKYSLDESLDIEVSKKVAMTLSCLLGASTENRLTADDDFRLYAKELLSKKYGAGEKNIIVILFIEGKFNAKTRTKRMIMEDLQKKILKKLSWLNCKVRVVDSTTHGDKYFTLQKAKESNT